MLDELNAHLQPRQAQAIIEGVASDTFAIFNPTFQGAVLRPPLWNTFFADALIAVDSTGDSSAKFADDTNIFQELHSATSNATMLARMHTRCERDYA